MARPAASMKEMYEKMEKIGEGRFGVVYKGLNRTTSQVVAIKRMRTELVPLDMGMPSFVLRELSILRELHHENIVHLLEVVHENSQLYLIFEYLEFDLQRYMEISPNYLTPFEIKCFTYQILQGIHHCHKHNIIHRDLKPQNLLIDRQALRLKIADFGLSRHFPGDHRTLNAFSHEVVTLWYRPPEILLGSDVYSTSVDMWSVGCILAEMAREKPLFQGMSEIEQLLRIFSLMGTPDETNWPGVSCLQDYKPVFPKWRSRTLASVVPSLEPTAVDLLCKLLRLDPSHRITAEEALEHGYFHDIRDDSFPELEWLEDMQNDAFPDKGDEIESPTTLLIAMQGKSRPDSPSALLAAMNSKIRP